MFFQLHVLKCMRCVFPDSALEPGNRYSRNLAYTCIIFFVTIADSQLLRTFAYLLFMFVFACVHLFVGGRVFTKKNFFSRVLRGIVELFELMLKSESRLRQSVAGRSLRIPRFDTRPFHGRFLVDKVALGRVFLGVLCCFRGTRQHS